MTRIVLFVALFALFTATVAALPSAGFAEDGKGVFSFFNRNKNPEGDRSKPTAPVFLKHNQADQGRSGAQKPYDMSGAKSYTKVARYEDSSVFEESRLASATLDAWNSNEVATAEAKAQKAVTQMLQHSQAAGEIARQAQLQAMALNEKRAVPQTTFQNGVQSGYKAALPQSIANPENPVQAAEPAPEDEPKRKQYKFFNRSE